MNTYRKHPGFTIVELLIVIVVIGILAAITIVAYNGIQDRARSATLTSDLTTSAKQLKIDQATNSSYPATLPEANGNRGLKASAGTTYSYTVNNAVTPQTFCLSATNGTMVSSITQDTSALPGGCTNLALGATSPNALITNGITTSTPYYDGGAGPQSVTVDLGSVQNVSVVKVWHYYNDGRTYNATKTEVSTDNANWTTVFDSSTSGTYAESASGKTTSFSTRPVRYIRDSTNGSSTNVANHWVEIQAF
jgi:prepilin-type N-terminal cleavage/methylation domain-containing protein